MQATKYPYAETRVPGCGAFTRFPPLDVGRGVDRSVRCGRDLLASEWHPALLRASDVIHCRGVGEHREFDPVPPAVVDAPPSSLGQKPFLGVAFERVGPILLFVLGVWVIWAPPRPPMVDLPQHAGQVALLRDLMLGRSPWTREVRINLFTPYLLGYGLAWPLSMIMPVAAALKLVLTGAYAAFGAVCVAIRRELNAAPQLDAYFFVSFFGFAYSIGMYTFLVAAPAGLALVWLSIRYARAPSLVRGLILSAVGVAVLFSHGLIFLFSCGLALGVVWLNAKDPKRALARSWPFAVPLIVCAVVFAVTRERETALSGDFAAKVDMGSLGSRAIFDLLNSFGFPEAGWPVVCLIVMIALPFVGGLRLNLRRVESLAIAAGVLVVLAFAPRYAWSTNWLYERFALFLLPAYAWLFDPGVRPRSGAARFVSTYAGVASIATAGFVLVAHLDQALRFSRETSDFEVVLARAEPGQRALSIPLDMRSAADPDRWAYLHFALWYQADKQGFVDYNFAALHPQIVRFSGARPPLYNFDHDLAKDDWFDWRRDGGQRYRYFFVRHSRPIPARLFMGAECQPVQIASSGPWALFERRPCKGGVEPAKSP